mmetsp:Transcript_18431/g.45674  ORF Transcript_18431/g.45674 Transcript_18431/m.45674 type:complete len:193 (-) Transcript_18431:184-762(-)
MVRSLAVLSVLLFANCVLSFESSLFHRQPKLCRVSKAKNPRSFASIWATGNDENSEPDLSSLEENGNTEGDLQKKRKMKPTTARIGGRRTRSRGTTKVPAQADSSSNNGISSFLSKFRTPALAVLLLLLVKGFFSGGEPSTYYYSYESTVYETRSYISDGEVKTSRSESRNFKSNIPGMDQKSLYFDKFDDY